jgi:hypothetical protein
MRPQNIAELAIFGSIGIGMMNTAIIPMSGSMARFIPGDTGKMMTRTRPTDAECDSWFTRALSQPLVLHLQVQTM